MNVGRKNPINTLPNETASSVSENTNMLKTKHTDFDYDGVQNLYLKELECLVKQKKSHSVCHWNRSSLYNKILQIKKLVKPYDVYEVITVKGEDWLINKRFKPNDPIVRYLPAEDCFDVIAKAHIETDHGNSKAMVSATKSKYRFPTCCVALFLKCCNVCSEPSSSLKEDKSTWYLTIIEMKRANDTFKYMLIYIERSSKYTLLRPLISKSVHEVTLELFKIFLVFGAPLKLYTTVELIDFIRMVADKLTELTPWFNCRMQPLRRYQDGNKNYVSSVLDALHSWMNETGCDKWELGCHIVQWKNNTTRQVIKSFNRFNEWTLGVPYELFFGCKMNAFHHVSSNEVPEDLKSTKWYQNITVDKEDSSPSYYNNQEEAKDTKTSEKTILETDKVYSICCVCNMSLLVQYKCRSCRKPTHSDCGTIVREIRQNKHIFTVRCNLC